MDTPGGCRSEFSRLRLACILAVGAFVAALIAWGPGAAPASAAAPEGTDVMFVFDTSGSMGGELEEAKEKIRSVMEEIRASIPNVAFGVANVEDIPGYDEGKFDETKTNKQYEEEPEKAWRLDQPLSTEPAAAAAAIEKLTIGGGGDGPEAYARSLWETDTNPNVGWRNVTHHEIVQVADNVPHDTNLNEGIPPEQQLTEPFTDGFSTWPNTGEEPGGEFGIPGTQWKAGTNLGIRSVASMLAADGKPLQAVEFFGEETKFLPYWSYWAGLSGGHAFNGLTGEFAKTLTKAIETGTVKPPPPCPPGTERQGEACVAPPAPTSSSPALSGAGHTATSLTVQQGTPVTDTAALSGPNIAAAGGTVSYAVYADAACTKLIASAGSAAVVAGKAGTSAPETLPPGTYFWQDSYSGDARNAPSHSACGTVIETVLSPPVLGKTVNIEIVSGTVRIKYPPGFVVHGALAHAALSKGGGFVPLTETRQIPVGSELDTTSGTVRLTTATATANKTQAGEFGAGLFNLLQNRKQKGLTELKLVNNRTTKQACFTTGKGKKASLAKKLSSSTLGKLKANSHGKFTIHGTYSAGTVRGTTWSVSNQCNGTLTAVTRGKVEVRDFVRRKTITLFSGQKYLARKP